jgi:hypothetical protein
MSAAREKDSADFDLEAFIDLFDEALTSDDPSVQKTLQHLMVICALARNHDKHDRRNGPLRRMFDDQHEILRRLERLEVNNAGWRNGGYNPSAPYGPVISPSPTIWPQPAPTTPIPGTGTGGWPGPGPNQIWCGTSTSATSISLANDSAVAKSTTSYAYDPPNNASEKIAERVDDLLKSNYRGSSVGTKNVKIT